MIVRPWRRLSAEELMLLNCGAGEDSSASLGLQGDQTNQPWIFIGRTDAEAEAPIVWPPDVKNGLTGKDPDTRKDQRREGGEGDDRGWDGWMASLAQWTWVWVSSRSWWWTGKPGVLQSMGSQRVGHNWATELNYYSLNTIVSWLINRKIIEFSITKATI